MAARVRYARSRNDGRWRFAVIGGNNEIQCPSQGYATKWGARIGFRRLKRNIATIQD